jgi:dolichol-phosphate mannosyltransferase
MPTVGVSVVVPTYCEAENLPRLVPRVAAALTARGWPWEIIVVDDNSPDNTPAVLTELSGQWPQFRYLIRKTVRGLSSAVLAGMAEAHYDYLLVMDADLSHPPESIPSLIDPLLRGSAEFVIGSRYVAGGKTEDWGRFRWLNSAVATMLCRPLAQGVHDPMAGFFAVPRQVYLTANQLNPIGYKIALELIVKGRVSRIVEVPIVFHNRLHGESKLTLREQLKYLEHLSRLYDYKFPIAAPRIKYFIVALGAALVGVILFVLGHTLVGWPFLPGLAAGLAGVFAVVLLFFIYDIRIRKSDLIIRYSGVKFIIIGILEFIAGLAAGELSAPYTGRFTAVLISIVVMLLIHYFLYVCQCGHRSTATTNSSKTMKM